MAKLILVLAYLGAVGWLAAPLGEPVAQSVPDESVDSVMLAGDFDGDGDDDVVTAWLGRSGERGFLTWAGGDARTTTPVLPIWSAHRADLDGDGRLEVVAGSWSSTPRHDEPEPHRAAWVFGVVEGRFVTLWRGSAFSRPLRDLATGDLDGDGRTEIIALERLGERCFVTAYGWTGFGVVARGSLAVACDGLAVEPSLGQDNASVVVLTEAGSRTVRLDGAELILDARP